MSQFANMSFGGIRAATAKGDVHLHALAMDEHPESDVRADYLSYDGRTGECLLRGRDCSLRYGENLLHTTGSIELLENGDIILLGDVIDGTYSRPSQAVPDQMVCGTFAAKNKMWLTAADGIARPVAEHAARQREQHTERQHDDGHREGEVGRYLTPQGAKQFGGRTGLGVGGAVARVTARSLTEKMLFEPFAQLSVTTAKMHDGSIFDSDRDGAVAGEGFKTTADNRVWGTLEVGADAGWRFDVADLVSVKPQFGVSMRTSVGHTDWGIESRLFDGSASSAASYDSAQRFALRLQAGIELASSGYSDSKSYFWSRNHEGKTEPYAWTLLLAGSYERASDWEQSGSLSLQYRQLF